jgi:hypothetical protein
VTTTPTPYRSGAPLTDHREAVRALAKHWPGDGGRQRAHGALIGGLLRDGLPVTHVEAIVETLCEATGDEEVQKRLARVAETKGKQDARRPTTGWPALISALGNGGPEAVTRFRQALGLTLTVAALARHKRLPVAFLQEQGLRDLPESGVGIPYHTPDGKEVVKRRTELRAGDGSYWPKGQPLLAYGEARLDEAVKAGHLVLVEGESDTWTLWHHGIPALGLPGADTVEKTLHFGHVSNIPLVYVVEEADEAGKTFVQNVARRLASLGWDGELNVVRFPGAKDVSELHCQDSEAFDEAWQEVLRQARPTERTAAAPAAPPLPADPPWPAPLAEEAFQGLAGDIVRAIEPASEADPAAILVQTIVGFGNLIGRTAHFRVEADRHFANEFAILVGRTGKARKGTSWGQVYCLMRESEEEWATRRVQTGLSSGEGLVWGVRDKIMKRERVKERGEPVRYEEVEADPGVADKRLCIVEPEYANVLKMMERQGNTLSAVLRQAWEGGDLGTLTKNSPTRATESHVSLIGHITKEELRRYLSATEQANGFGNRHLWVCIHRSKLLPDGGRMDEGALSDLRTRLAAAIAAARQVGEMSRDGEAREIWREVYGTLSGDRPGLTGALLGRAEAHVLRLSLIYALLDRSAVIRAPHLMAALAVWEYCEQSVRHIFGDALGDPVADELLRLLRAAPNGMSRWEMSNNFGRNVPSDRIGRALALLAEHGFIRQAPKQQEGRGRPEERWCATRTTRG